MKKWLYSVLARPGTIVVCFTVALALIVYTILFVKPYIGMADNGDYYREIHNLGLYYLTDNFDDRHFGYFNRLFGIRQHPFEQTTQFVSSLSLVIRTALSLDLWFTWDNVFDLRTMGAIYSVTYLVAFYLLLKLFGTQMSLPVLVGTGALAVLIFGDVGYVAYFNSFYGEPASYILLFLTLGFGFRLLRERVPATSDFILFFLCSALFVAAKQQNAPIGILLAVINARIFFLRKDMRWKIVVSGLTFLLLVISVFVYAAIKDGISHINQYHTVTRGILESSTNPERDMEELGLDKKFSVLAGTTYYDKYSMEHSESALMNEQFYPNAGYGAVLKYYLLHMDRAVQKLDLASKHAYSIRPLVIGNYEKTVNKDYGAKANFFSVWSSFKEKFFPKSFRFLAIFYAIYYGFLTKFYVDYYRRNETKGMIRLELFALVGLIGVLQLSVSFLGAGDADLAKHLFLFNVTFDWMFITMAVYVMNYVYVKAKTKVGAGVLSWKPKRSISG
ncbi:hypothetical protein J4772_10495 [Cohnella sp. LGH]|uniref:glycan biosynthesis hexose transferase WsfD n=1 Tax=Cohnella sp. LGH TaxID=1619153 RepID=UPI001ADABAD8|nr:hypothetical protein [Cohnella sp. LGH]QTH44784.1 hypothetical protein J4772_10495 [Cohnella sp. LGH]